MSRDTSVGMFGSEALGDKTMQAATATTRDMGLERKLKRALEGGVRFDAFTRGRYSTDASIYQIMPMGVVMPKTADDLRAVIEIAADAGVPLIARGGGTSQNGHGREPASGAGAVCAGPEARSMPGVRFGRA